MAARAPPRGKKSRGADDSDGPAAKRLISHHFLALSDRACKLGLSANTISGSWDDGLDIGRDANKLLGNESTANVDTGIRVGAARNRVFQNTATGNAGWNSRASSPAP
jgi:hypothetical protein